MKLEDEIKQKKFRSKQQKAMLNIIVTASYINTIQGKLLKPYNLTPQQYNVMRILRGQNGNPVSISLIQDRMLDKQSNASRLIDKLETKQLVHRFVCPNDRRQMDISITQSGLDLLLEIDQKLIDSETSITLSDDEADIINNILDKIRQYETTININ
ncbi:MAG: MarR family transcriptional regulator [Bacteroidota bacterium]